jgi:hypothetical protein
VKPWLISLTSQPQKIIEPTTAANDKPIYSVAKEFEKLHKHIEKGINSSLDYLASICYFTLFKIKENITPLLTPDFAA